LNPDGLRKRISNDAKFVMTIMANLWAYPNIRSKSVFPNRLPCSKEIVDNEHHNPGNGGLVLLYRQQEISFKEIEFNILEFPLFHDV
jgi:hypothetical protein